MNDSPGWLGNGWLNTAHLLLLGEGLIHTLVLSICVILLATPLGGALAIAQRLRLPGHRLLTLSSNAIRNTPLLVQLLLCYFGIGSLLPENWMIWLNTPHLLWSARSFSLGWPSFEWLSAWLTLSAYASAFIAGEIRSGLNAVGQGQWEAASAQGMTRSQILRLVVLPQAMQVSWPSLLGQYMNTVKNTSLAMTIGVLELSYRARQIESETLLAFQAFAMATLGYVLLVLCIQRLEGRGPGLQHERPH